MHRSVRPCPFVYGCVLLAHCLFVAVCCLRWSSSGQACQGNGLKPEALSRYARLRFPGLAVCCLRWSSSGQACQGNGLKPEALSRYARLRFPGLAVCCLR